MREYNLYSNAMAFYQNTLKAFEQKHQLSTQAFLRKFETGQLGDEADYFDWYAFAKLLAKSRKAQSAIRSAIQWYKSLSQKMKHPSVPPRSSYPQTFKNILGPGGEETVYVKGRITIIDSSTLEIAIFVTEFRGKLAVDKYRLHYMNGSGQMLFAMIMPHIIQKLLLILIKNTHLTE